MTILDHLHAAQKLLPWDDDLPDGQPERRAWVPVRDLLARVERIVREMPDEMRRLERK